MFRESRNNKFLLPIIMAGSLIVLALWSLPDMRGQLLGCFLLVIAGVLVGMARGQNHRRFPGRFYNRRHPLQGSDPRPGRFGLLRKRLSGSHQKRIDVSGAARTRLFEPMATQNLAHRRSNSPGSGGSAKMDRQALLVPGCCTG